VVPEAAADIAAAVAQVVPDQAVAIAVAVGKVVPAMAPQIAAAVAQVVPKLAAQIAQAMGAAVPQAAGAVSTAVAGAVPGVSGFAATVSTIGAGTLAAVAAGVAVVGATAAVVSDQQQKSRLGEEPPPSPDKPSSSCTKENETLVRFSEKHGTEQSQGDAYYSCEEIGGRVKHQDKEAKYEKWVYTCTRSKGTHDGVAILKWVANRESPDGYYYKHTIPKLGLPKKCPPPKILNEETCACDCPPRKSPYKNPDTCE
jgi:hypothetical protein